MSRTASVASPAPQWRCPAHELADLVADLLAGGLSVRMAVSGASMAPLLRDGDTVLLEPVCPAQLGFGDLILYRAGSGALVLHRLLRVLGAPGEARRVQTRGDATLRLDEPVDCGRVLARVRRIEKTAPGAGGAVIELRSRRGRLRGIATAAIKLAASGVYYKLRGSRDR